MSFGRSLGRSHLGGGCWCLAGPAAWPRSRSGPQRRSRAPCACCWCACRPEDVGGRWALGSVAVAPAAVSARRFSCWARLRRRARTGGWLRVAAVLRARVKLKVCRCGEAFPVFKARPAPGCSFSVFSGASTSCRLGALGGSPPGCSRRCSLALRRVLGSAPGASQRLGAHGDVRGASTSARFGACGGAPSRCLPRWPLASQRVFAPG